jgi:hypothetical protein
LAFIGVLRIVAGQPLPCRMNRSYLNRTLLMLKFPHSLRTKFWIVLIGLASLAFLPSASGQTADFYLLASPPNPSSVYPGVNSTASITVGTTNGFNSPVALSCSVAPPQAANPCTVSPSTPTPPATASLTFTSAGLPSTHYALTVTGTSGGQTASVALSPINVLAVAPQYGIAVTTALSPSTLTPGSTATAVISVTSTSGYSGSVTFGCTSITPLVEPSPICSFSPEPLPVTDGEIATTTLTINTTNTNLNQTTNASVSKRPSQLLYGFLIPLPFIVIAGIGRPRRRSRKFLGLLGLLVIAAGLITLPACSSTQVNNGNITPGNTYTFTIGAYDANGVSPLANVTVALTVN